MDAYETRLYIAVLITGVITGCIILYFAYSVLRNQRKFVRIHRAYFLNEVSLLENERRRIARDLHDELGPLLSITKMLISDVPPASEKARHHLGKANGNLEEIIHKLGEISINLTPGSLLKKGLDFALRDFFEDVQLAANLKIAYRYEVSASIPPSTGIHLYRIVREAVHNCVKHAGANVARIDVKQFRRKLYIRYQDNGRGFRVQEAMEAAEGHGLRSMKSRTEMLGGHFICQSAPQTGTYYFIEIPLS